MPRILREYWIYENGKLAQNLGFDSCLGYGGLCEEIKKLKKSQPSKVWTFRRGHRYKCWPDGRTKNIDE